MPQSVSSFASVCIAVAVITLPILIVPLTGIAPVFQKGILLAFLLGLTLCALGIELLITRRSIPVPDAFVLAGLPLLVIAAISFFVSGTNIILLAGSSFEIGTVGSLLLFFAALVAGASLTVRICGRLLHLFVGTILATTALSIAVMILAPELLGGATLVGPWTELCFLIAAALIIAVTFADTEGEVRVRVSYKVVSAVLGACFVLFFDTSAALVSLVFVACITAWRFRLFFTDARRHAFPWAACICTIFIAVLLLLGVGSLALRLEPIGRPSFRATELVVIPSMLESRSRTLVGSGPATFSQVWDKYRPVEFNATAYWDATVTYGYSTLLTFAVTFGILGLLALLLIPTAFFMRAVSLFARATADGVHGLRLSALLASSALALFSWAATLLYPVELTLFLVSGLAMGLFVSLSREGEVVVYRPERRGFMVLMAAGILASGALFLWMSSGQFAAALYHARGIVQVSVDIRAASSSLEKAATIWPIPMYERDASRALFVDARARVPTSAEDTEAIRLQITRALELADHSLYTNPDDLSATLSRAFLYIQLVPDGPLGSAQKAKESLERAHELAPTRPDVPYMRAALEMRLGNPDLAREYLKQALKLKPDYSNALEILQALEPTP